MSIHLSLYTEHSYAKDENQTAEKKGTSNTSVDSSRKPQSLSKQTDRLCFADVNRCVVCKHRLTTISLSGVMCSKECLDKSQSN